MAMHCPRPQIPKSVGRSSLSLLRATVPSEGLPLPSQAGTSVVAHPSLPKLTHDKLLMWMASSCEAPGRVAWLHQRLKDLTGQLQCALFP